MKFGNNKVHHASRRLRAIRPLMGASPRAVKPICTFDFRQKHLNSSYSIFGPSVKVCQSSSRPYVQGMISMKVVLPRSWGAEVQYMRHWLRTSQLRQAETRDAIRRHSRNLLRPSDLRRDRRAVTETQAPPPSLVTWPLLHLTRLFPILACLSWCPCVPWPPQIVC